MRTEHENSSLDLTRPGIIEASAGTGKTFTIAEIYIALLCGEKTFPPEKHTEASRHAQPVSVRDILVVTFTEAATAELRSRLHKRIRDAIDAEETIGDPKQQLIALKLADSEFDEAAISTIHGFCMRILQDFSHECNMPQSITPQTSISEEMERFAARYRAKQIALGDSDFQSISAKEISDILQILSRNPGMKISPKAPHSICVIAENGLPQWEKERKRSNSLSFDEILLRLRDALYKNPELAEKISARYKIALVDEFQDTDPIQWDIFNKIFVSRGRPFFCVGDPKQAIYEFRGGDICTYREARKTILTVGNSNSLRLKNNWRSTPEAIAAFNEIFAYDKEIKNTYNIGTYKNPNNVEVQISSNLDYIPTAPRPGLDFAKNSPAIFLRRTSNIPQIQDLLIKDVETLVKTKKRPPEDIAILVSGNAECRAIQRRITKLGIPAVTTADSSVLEEDEAEDIACIMDYMLNPNDIRAMRLAAISRFFGGKYDTICGDDNFGTSEGTDLRRQFSEAKKIWEKHGFFAAFSHISKQFGFEENISKFKNPSRTLINTKHILEIIHKSESPKILPPTTLVEKFSAMRSAPNKDDDAQQIRIDSDAKAVQIITMHKSKGLEYPIVFLPSLCIKDLLKRNNQPQFEKRANANGSPELIINDKSTDFKIASIEKNATSEACLFYVALTRAKSYAVIYHFEGIIGRGYEADSYANKIMLAAGLLKNTDDKSPLPHWGILDEKEEIPFPEYTSETDNNSAGTTPTNSADLIRRATEAKFRLRRDAWGVFSFSSIAKGHAQESIFADENTEANRTADVDATSSKIKIYPAPPYCDLPAGSQFGTLVHEVFEKLDYSSMNNLDQLLDSTLPQLSEWTSAPQEKKSAIRTKFTDMFSATLSLPIVGENKLSDVDGEQNTIRELEFFFPMKKTFNVYSALYKVFSSWGGIYKKTADMHWLETNGRPPLATDGLMNGFIDLVFRVGNKYYIADWKTNRIMREGDTILPEESLEDEIVENAYALQWAIYAAALRKFLKSSLRGKYDHATHFGGIRYVFVRWGAIFKDDEISEQMLDQLESAISE